MKRPVVIAIIGYIIGIIVGIYLNISIFPFCIIFATIIALKNIKKEEKTANYKNDIEKEVLNYETNKNLNLNIKVKPNKIEKNLNIKNNKYVINNNKKNEKYNFKKKKLKLFSIKRYSRYIKIFINSKVIILFLISMAISNSIVLYQNNQYNKIQNELQNTDELTLEGIIVSSKEEKQYNNRYKIECNLNDFIEKNSTPKLAKAPVQKSTKNSSKLVHTKNKKIKFYITISKKIKIEYGDKIKFTGNYQEPEEKRNYKGFDYKEYLKQQKIYGTIKSTDVEIIGKKQGNILLSKSNKIQNTIIEKSQKLMSKENYSILLGLILGYKQDIEEDVQENFQNASMAHILAVSGMHVSYIILGLNYILKKIIGKRNSYIACIFILVFYMFLTNFSPSITRAGIMGILLLLSKLVHRKNDIYTSMAISLFIILGYNPFLIQNVGLQLSYGGILGIIILNKKVSEILQVAKNKWEEAKNKLIIKYYMKFNLKNNEINPFVYNLRVKIEKIEDKILDIISVSLSVQIFILPILVANMNKITPYFLISNLILSIVVGPVVIIGFLFIIMILINSCTSRIIICKFLFENMINFLKPFVIIGTKLLTLISNIGKLPGSKIYIPTPTLFSILIYYISISTYFIIKTIYSSKNPTSTELRIKNIIAIIKIKLRINKKKVNIIFVSLLICTLCWKITPKNLKIHFVDVGQGDSCFIETPQNKTILIDGGGQDNYNVGKNTLLPYILDRGYNSIDYAIISHFDNDHVGGILYLIDEIKIKNIIIGKQYETSENYEKFVEKVKTKKIKVIVVEAGNKINIEKELNFEVLWPSRKRNDFRKCNKQ